MLRRGANPANLPFPGGPDAVLAGVRLLCGVLLLGLCAWLSGCTYTGGKLLYLFGVGREPLIKAEFRLTTGPILIVVDDFEERVDRPVARQYLVDELTEQLIKRKVVQKIIPHGTLDQLRQSDPGFDKRGCRELGELAGAEQVLWIEVRDFLAEEQFEDIFSAAYFAVSVKVINVLEKERNARVRLWPSSSEGRLVVVHLPGDAVARLKTTNAICRELASKLATEITDLFRDHRKGDPASKT